ncbi:UNVERIFIED_ORG: tRNA A37 threonylcarbamoyladenosine synthetase subunit TsaC/SUA5/YrdC [Pseudomonas reinekei]|nr:tRNA A37 threonylcarbamoyladenosine synthetase subunit TsaC/SUA5/YrdC [Pseudomonas reinekei]
MVNSWRVQQAAQAIRAGAVIAYPTEAVWGLGCDPWDEEAVERLLLIKGRSEDKGLILVADNIRQFDFLFDDFPEVVDGPHGQYLARSEHLAGAAPEPAAAMDYRRA